MNCIRNVCLLFLLIGTSPSVLRSDNAAKPDLILQGSITHAQNQTYVNVPFQVPAGVHRISVTFHYTGKNEHTTLDLGIFDPQRFRGASGGNKDHFTISETDATPSYLPGPILAGRWVLLIAVPNIRAGVISHYKAEIFFDRNAGTESFSDGPLRLAAGWYRGDLHMHTGHSDGSCPDESGQPVPCPVFVTAEAAVRRGLDFIAITDHNTTSQYEAERELQPYFDRLLLIPGREITTFQGHANLFGTTRFLDYRVGTSTVPDLNAVAREAHRLGAIISINHPNAPSGEMCLGCGWKPQSPVDLRLFNAVEAVNGGAMRGPYSGVSYWERQLERGFRITGIGGSDNHHGDWPLSHPDSVGSPTTVVYAQNLSVAAILEGIRAGHVFIDLTGSRNRVLEMTAYVAGQPVANMGDALAAPAGSRVAITVRVVECSGSKLEIFADSPDRPAFASQRIAQDEETLHFTWPSDGKRHWLLPQVDIGAGEREMVGNPVYVNYSAVNARDGVPAASNPKK